MKLLGIYKSENSLKVREDYLGGPIEVSMNEYFVFDENGIVGYSIGEFVSFPEFRPFKIRIHQAARRGRISERITNFKPEYNEENKIH